MTSAPNEGGLSFTNTRQEVWFEGRIKGKVGTRGGREIQSSDTTCRTLTTETSIELEG